MLPNSELLKIQVVKRGTKPMTTSMIAWKLRSSFAGDREHSLLYRGEYKGHGVQMEIHTPVKKSKYYADLNRFGEPKTYFFIVNDDRGFKTEAELIAAIEGVE